MEMVQGIVTGTPVYVWALLAFGLYMGGKAFVQRKVSLVMMAVLPGLFLYLSVPALLGIVGPNPIIGVAWALALAAGGLVGWYFLTPEPVSIERSKGTMVVPGTWTVLVLFVMIFSVKYTFGIENAIDPELAARPAFLFTVFGLSGLATGVVLGRTAKNFAFFFGAVEAVVE